MTIKEARQFAQMTQQEVSDTYGIPIRSLQKWETGDRSCPDYVEEWLVEKLKQEAMTAVITIENGRWVCYLTNPADPHGEKDFAWSFPVHDGWVSEGIMLELQKLNAGGWKVIFN